MNRYEKMFTRLAEQKEGAFIPFVVVGDPNLEWSLEIMQTLIDSGADGLELGLAFSDPVADGPVIQRADIRVLSSEIKREHVFALIKKLRAENHSIPIGMLTYANLVYRAGIDRFYSGLQASGVDSLLIADVPILEIRPFAESARAHGICQVMIVPPNIDDERLKKISEISSGYIYVVTRSGVTGVSDTLGLSSKEVFQKLRDLKAAPGLYGFGISTSQHVIQALRAGASGAISGSAVTQIIEKNLENKVLMLKELSDFTRDMKNATKVG